MANHTYKILLRKEPEGGYTVLVPALQGCVTWGETVDHAMQMAKESIEGYIETLKELGQPVPDDSETLEGSLILAA